VAERGRPAAGQEDYKLYIGGASRARDRAGRMRPRQNVARASRKDVRDAVGSPRRHSRMGAMTAYTGVKCCTGADMLEARTREFAELTGRSRGARAVDRFVWYAGGPTSSRRCGLGDPVAGPYFQLHRARADRRRRQWLVPDEPHARTRLPARAGAVRGQRRGGVASNRGRSPAIGSPRCSQRRDVPGGVVIS